MSRWLCRTSMGRSFTSAITAWAELGWRRPWPPPPALFPLPAQELRTWARPPRLNMTSWTDEWKGFYFFSEPHLCSKPHHHYTVQGINFCHTVLCTVTCVKKKKYGLRTWLDRVFFRAVLGMTLFMFRADFLSVVTALTSSVISVDKLHFSCA